ncbi:hypothetical protein ACIQNG_24315 [Streptomyces sp. NPDC091377]|uniref:hypothetical protein n=1 Tax=Streptomyces sp. NPDC091377 TaxID=3365995 RepID=UPI00381F74C2
MLALRLSRAGRPAVQVRRLLVAAASGGTGFLLLCTLGHALSHPHNPGGSALRLAWCLVPVAATVQFAVAVARTDPGTRPRPGLSAIGLGPARLMAVSATTTALSTLLGSMLALLFFLHLRGDLSGMPFDGAASDVLAADRPLPLPAALTLLAVVPMAASIATALALRPRERGAVVRRIRWSGMGTAAAGTGVRPTAAATRSRRAAAVEAFRAVADTDGFGTRGRTVITRTATTDPDHAPDAAGRTETNGTAGPTGAARTAAEGFRRRARKGARGATGTVDPADPAATADTADTAHAARGDTDGPDGGGSDATRPATGTDLGTGAFPAPRQAPTGLPWGVAVLAAGLAVEAYATRMKPGTEPATLPGGLAAGPMSVLVGWTLTAVGLALAGPGLTHLCGRLLQAVRPGALRLLAGRVLMAEAGRIGRPLGVVCAVASAAWATAALQRPGGTDEPVFGPLTTLGALVVAGCTVATLCTAAVEARHARSDTTAALLRLGAPATMLRSAALLRAGTLLALFGPLTLLVAELAAQPLIR